MVIEGAWGWDAHAGMSWEWVSDVVATDPPLPPTVISNTSKISQRVGDQAAEAEVDGLDRQGTASSLRWVEWVALLKEVRTDGVVVWVCRWVEAPGHVGFLHARRKVHHRQRATAVRGHSEPERRRSTVDLWACWRQR